MDVDKVISDIVITDKRGRENVARLREKLYSLSDLASEKKQAYVKEFREEAQKEYDVLAREVEQDIALYREEENNKTKAQRDELEKRFVENREEWIKELFQKVIE